MLVGVDAGEVFPEVIDLVVLNQVVKMRGVRAAVILVNPLRQFILVQELTQHLKHATHPHVLEDLLSSIVKVEVLDLVVVSSLC